MSKHAATEQELSEISLPLVFEPDVGSVARTSRTTILVFLVILLLVVSGAHFFEVSWGYLAVFLFFWLMIITSELLKVWNLRHRSGSWKITLDEQGLDWQSPDPEVDHSFFLPLDQIECIGTELTPTAKNSHHYQKVIVLTNGHRAHLSNRAAIDMQLVYIALEKLGKPFRLTHGREYGPLPLTRDIFQFRTVEQVKQSRKDH